MSDNLNKKEENSVEIPNKKRNNNTTRKKQQDKKHVNENDNTTTIEFSSTSPFKVLTVIILIALISFNIYLNSQIKDIKQTQPIKIDSQIQELVEQNKVLTNKINDLENIPNKEYDDSNLKNNISNLSKEINKLISQISINKEEINSLNNKVNDFISPQEKLAINIENSILEVFAKSFIRQANLELIVGNNKQALSFLIEARELLVKANNEENNLLLEATNNDIENINNNKILSNVDIFNKLSDLLVNLEGLAFIDNLNGEQLDHDHNHNTNNWSYQLYNSIDNFFKKFITIKNKSDGSSIEDIIEFNNITISMKLRIQTAFVALQNYNDSLYHSSLNNLLAISKSYLDLSNINNTNFISNIEQLQQYSVELPSNLSSYKIVIGDK